MTWIRRIAAVSALIAVLILATGRDQRASAAPTGNVDVKALVITGTGTEPSFFAITDYLSHLGVPYSTLIASQTPLDAASLRNGAKGRYSGIVLATGSLAYEVSPGQWASAFDDAEWQTLWNYETQYGVRQLAFYAFPGGYPDAFGFNLPERAFDSGASPVEGTLTDRGRQVFDYMNPNAVIPVRNAWVYLAKPTDATTHPLVVTADGYALAAIHDYPDGRQSLAITVDQETNLIHSLLLEYGAIRWVMNGLILGERHVYLSAQVDDYFLDDDLWDTVTLRSDVPGLNYRMTGDDVTKLAGWQSSIRATAAGADFQLEQAFNGYGTVPGIYPNDTLTPATAALQANFAWLNHTWDHLNLDNATNITTIKKEVTKNRDLATSFPLSKFNGRALVTGEYSGLHNPIVVSAFVALNIRWVDCDASQYARSCGSTRPPFNTAVPNPIAPALLQIPRYPTNIFYSSSTPLEQTSRYNFIYHDFYGRDLTYQEIIGIEGDTYLRYMLVYDISPLMFHQSNQRAYDGQNSLLSDAISNGFEKYRALMALPVQSLTLAEIGLKAEERMQYNTGNVAATVDPVKKTLTLTGTAKTIVPVTGVSRGARVETYGGEPISYLTIPKTGTLTIPLP